MIRSPIPPVDASVNRLIACLFQNPTLEEREAIARKLDHQDKEITKLRRELAEQAFAWVIR
jgi:restriction endonuclease S subunit